MANHFLINLPRLVREAAVGNFPQWTKAGAMPRGCRRPTGRDHTFYWYNIGWSHGKEQLESGKPDMMKGSYYANPILDVPTTELSHVERYPSYCGPNIWPRDAVPELELLHQMVSKCMRMKVYYKYFFDLDVIKVVSFNIFLVFRGTLDSLNFYQHHLERDEKLRFPKEVNIHEVLKINSDPPFPWLHFVLENSRRTCAFNICVKILYEYTNL